MLREPNEQNWHQWTGPLGQDPPSKQELEAKRKAEVAKKEEERRQEELGIQGDTLSQPVREILDVVND